MKRPGNGLSATVAAVSLSGIASSALVAADVTSALPQPVLPLVVTIATGLFALGLGVYFGRLCVHVYLGYLQWPEKGDDRRAQWYLNLLVLVDAVLVTMWAEVVAEMTSGGSPLALAVSALVLRVALPGLAGATAVSVAAVGRRRATEALDLCPLVKWLKDSARKAEADGLYRALMHWWDEMRTPVESVSTFVVSMALFLSMIVAVTAPAAIGEVVRERKAATEKTDNKVDRTRSATPNVSASPVAPRGGSYPQQCGTKVAPGDGAPYPYDEQIYALFLGGDGIDGVGATAGGCAELAFQAPGRPGLWLARGRCGTELRSLAIAARGYRPALVLQEAARTVDGLVRDRRFIAASERISVSRGDLYLLYTRAGTRILIRRTTSAGSVQPDPFAPVCAQFRARNVRYVHMPETLAPLWVSAIGIVGNWLWPVNDMTDGASGHTFAFTQDDGRDVVARAECVRGKCTMWLGGRVLVSTQGRQIDFDEVREFTP